MRNERKDVFIDHRSLSRCAMIPSVRKKAISFSLLLAALCCAGCMRTTLRAPAPKPQVFELAALNRNPIHLVIAPADKQNSLGHQFLLLGIPFGAVDSSNLDLLIQRAAYEKLTLRGYTPIVGPISAGSTTSAAPALYIRAQNAQASAYDLLVTRHLSCSLDLQASLDRSDAPRRAIGSGSFEHFGAFAFQRELSLCFSEALNQALDTLLLDLRI